MNSKMTTNSQLSTTESKKQKQKLSKQLEEGKNHRNGDHMEGYQQGGGEGSLGGKIQGLRSIIGRHKIDKGEVKNSIGNGEAKELICTTYGHELRGGNTGRKRGKRYRE